MEGRTAPRYLLAEATIDAADMDQLADWLKTHPWLTQGPLVRQFECAWSDWLGTDASVYVNSGSSANFLMYYAALLSGRLKNKRVVVPALSWATTVAPAFQLGFEPIMCDAELGSLTLDLDHLERLLTEHEPAAVIVVHTLGIPNHMDRLLELKRRHGFLLMEDACPATGSRYRGKLVGTFGEMSSFSFYFGHHISTIEGGMVATSDEELHDIMLHTRSHGWAKDVDPEKEARLAAEHDVLEFNRVFTFYHPGLNFRSTDLNAFIGLGQMKKLEWVIERRVENHRRYRERLAGAADYLVPDNPDGEVCSISFVALAASREHRERLGAALRANGIETRPLGGGSMGRQPFWTDRMGAQPLPVADRVHETSVMLPNHPHLGLADVDQICDVVLAVRA
jgi:CDP-6-deoxy-D-xylo-4-hexulose-3-dehydrase